MPNGAFEPGCHTCQFLWRDDSGLLAAFARRWWLRSKSPLARKVWWRYDPPPEWPNHNRSCRKHNIVYHGIMGEEFICRDWNLHSQFQEDDWHFGYVPEFLASDQFRLLNQDSLYYWLPDRTVLLDSFESLPNLILKANIFRNDQFGWAIYLPTYYHQHFPRPRFLLPAAGPITIILDGTEQIFRVTSTPCTEVVMTPLAAIPHGTESSHAATSLPHGKTGDESADSTERMLTTRSVVRDIVYSPDSSDILINWLDKKCDTHAMLNDNRIVGTVNGIPVTRGAMTMAQGFSVYIEVVDRQRVYKVRRIEPVSQEYVRNPD